MWGFDATTGHANYQSAQIRHPGAQCRNALATPNPVQTGARSRYNKGDAFIYAVWSANVVKSLGTGPSKGSKASREHSRSRGTGTPLLVPMPSHPRMAYNPHFQIGSVFYTTSNTPIGRQSGVAVMRD